MTTIAFKDGIIAADSQITAEDTRCNYEYIKIFVLRVNECQVPVAMAGAIADFEVFKSWFCKRDYPLELPDPETSPVFESFVAVMYYNGSYYECSQDLVFYPIGNSGAVGTGAEYATGAMEFGASAIEAIEVAKRLDIRTGKSVYWMDVKDMQIHRIDG